MIKNNFSIIKNIFVLVSIYCFFQDIIIFSMENFLNNLPKTNSLTPQIEQQIASLLSATNPNKKNDYRKLQLLSHPDKCNDPLLLAIGKYAINLENDQRLANFSLSKESDAIIKLKQKTTSIEHKTAEYQESYKYYWRNVIIAHIRHYYHQIIKFTFDTIFSSFAEKTSNFLFPENIIINSEEEPDQDKVIDRKSLGIYLKNKNAYFNNISSQYIQANTKINNHILSRNSDNKNLKQATQLLYNNAKEKLNKHLNRNEH